MADRLAARASAFFVVLVGREPQRATNQVCTTSGYRRWFALSVRLAGSVSGNAGYVRRHDRAAPGEPNVRRAVVRSVWAEAELRRCTGQQ